MTFLLIGAAAGVCSGLFGIGGGTIIVPALMAWAGFSPHQATGTSLAALLFPVGLLGVLAYHRAGDVRLGAAAWIALGILLGAWIGARLALKLSGQQLKLSFGLFLCAVGVYTAASGLTRR